jgi:microcystin-dependent protein
VSDAYLGEIQAFPYPWAMQGGFNAAWLPCLGQLLPIQAYTALFSLLGTYYGGNGTSNFALPNMQGQVTNNQGQGPGLSQRDLGEVLGSSVVTLLSNEMAMHTHGLQLGSKSATGAAPGPGTASNMAAIDPAFNGFITTAGNVTLAPNAVTLTGGGQSHDNMQPYLALVWCICYVGIYPSFS